MTKAFPRIYLFCDEGVRWPLAGIAEDSDMVSPRLAKRLRDWAGHFREHHDYLEGWDTRRSETWHKLVAVQIQRAAQRELARHGLNVSGRTCC